MSWKIKITDMPICLFMHIYIHKIRKKSHYQKFILNEVENYRTAVNFGSTVD